MIAGKKVVVVMPAYNAENTLERTVGEIDRRIADEIVLVDDHSSDQTCHVARRLGLHVIEHRANLGYGGNQKTCYRKALELEADIVVMIHPDYQYSPRLLLPMVGVISEGLFDVALASRILGGGAIKGGMPRYKYFFNRVLTLIENLLTGMKLSEYHTGYRAFTRQVLLRVNLAANSDDFVFDNQILVQAHYAGFRIAEITCPTMYFDEASTINFRRSVTYGLGCIGTAMLYLAARSGIYRDPLFEQLSFAPSSTQTTIG